MYDVEGDRLLRRSDHRADQQMVGSGELLTWATTTDGGGRRLVVARLE